MSRTARPQLKRWIQTKGPPPKRTPGNLHNLAQHIIPGSLTSTINTHRQANQDAKIRAVKTNPEFWDRAQFEEIQERRRGEIQSDDNRPMSLASSLPESFRNKVAEEASKHGLVHPKMRLRISNKDIREEQQPVRYHGQTYDGSLRPGEGPRLSMLRRLLLQRYELPSGQEISSEDDWKTQMDILRRTRGIVYNRGNKILGDNDFKMLVKFRTIMEYVGNIAPPVFVRVPKASLEPWAANSKSENLPVTQGFVVAMRVSFVRMLTLSRLDTEIETFMDWVEPTETEQLAREAVFDTTMGLIRDNLPNLSAVRVGSQVTGLAMPTSDADIRLYHPDWPHKPDVDFETCRAEVFKGMDVMFDAFNSHPAYIATERKGGQYPIVETTHKETGLTVQIVCGPSSKHSQQLVKQSLADHPHLKTLFTIVKTALDMRGLSSVYSGGLGSYAIFNMVLAALNLYRIEHPDPTTPATPATLLLYILDFYGNRYNPYAFGISASPFEFFRKRRKATETESKAATSDEALRLRHAIAKPVYLEHYLLCLQDPADGGNDLGRKSFAFKHVQATMRYMHEYLNNHMRDKHILCVLRGVVGRCDYVYDDRRTRLELFGETCERNPEPLIRVGPEGGEEEGVERQKWRRRRRRTERRKAAEREEAMQAMNERPEEPTSEELPMEGEVRDEQQTEESEDKDSDDLKGYSWGYL